MNRLNRSSLPVLLIWGLSMLLGACNLPLFSPTVDINQVGTAAAQTITAQMLSLTQTALAQATATDTPPALPPTEAPTELTPTAELPSPTNTVAVLPPTDTPTPPAGNPTITANVETNCRMGPSPDYPRVGYILPGQESTVVGVNAARTWWYIENPRRPGQYCWVWGETTRVTGNVALLPVITPPPPPTPVAQGVSFSTAFYDINICGGFPSVIFEVLNTGGETFRSMVLEIRNVTTGDDLYGPDLTNQPFMNSGGSCPPGNNLLPPGERKFVGGDIDWSVVSGDRGRAIIRLCTESHGDGECYELRVNFTFP